MSYTVILSGFSYETSGEKSISSVILDIYRMYLAIGNDENTDTSGVSTKGNIEFFIITDIVDVPDVVIQGLIENEITTDILNFIPGTHTESTRIDNVVWLPCKSIYEWNSSLEKIGTNISRLLFYYTGHGTYNSTSNILFPSRESLPLLKLRDMILKMCTPEAEVVYILDCCYSGSLDMPYRLETSTETYSLVNDNYFSTQNILVLSSCSESQVSYSETFGSHFTSRLLTSIEKTTNLSQILRDIYVQWKSERAISNGGIFSEVQVHSSYPTTPTFWSWIFKHSDGKRTDIYVNDNINCLIVAPI